MKRFITYLFTYENGTKGKNAGFIRASQRDALLELEVHIQGIGRWQGMGKVFLLVKGQGIPAGEFAVSQGRGVGKCTCDLRTVEAYADAPEGARPPAVVEGVAVRMGAQYYAASSWTEELPEGLAEGTFTVREQEPPAEEAAHEPTAPESAVVETAREPGEPEPAAPAVEAVDEALALETAREPGEPESAASAVEVVAPQDARPAESQQCPAEAPVQPPTRIDLSDIRSLPKKNWYLCNNSFLIHGFFHYHYLVVLELEENGQKKTYLGVPGVYERPERMMATLFGFPEFRAETDLITVQEMAEEPVGKFGYWLCRLEM